MIITSSSRLNSVWQLVDSNLELIQNIKEIYKCSFLTAKLIAKKNIEFQEISNFLNPKLKNNWIKTDLLPNIDSVSQKIIDIINDNGKVGIIGDYDVDGLCSTVILKEFFEIFEISTKTWIPERKDGYGPNEICLNFFYSNPVDLLILVDCGTNCHEFKLKYGKEIIIIDHHQSLNPIKDNIVNPNAFFGSLPDNIKSLCATSLVFFIVFHILKKLKIENYQRIMQSFLDLTALATVCDVMPLTNTNRAIIKSGMKEITKQNRIGLRQLINFASIKFPLTIKDISFGIGPRLNATGRIESPLISLDLLQSKSFEKCNELIHKIEMINNYRKQLQMECFQEALKIAKTDNSKILCLASENWNSGIVGIIAAMIQDEIGKPAIIGNICNGEIKASARSNFINIGMLIQKAVELGILEKGGGHEFAAGLTCKVEKWPKFKQWINTISTTIKPKTIEIDLICNLADIEDDYKILSPFGIKNDTPKILAKDLLVSKITDKGSYCYVIIEEYYKSFTFFINNSRKTLINELYNVLNKRIKFSAVISLEEKGPYVLEDINY